MRSWFVLILGVFVALPAVAEEKPGQGRYAVQPSADGFIRLDTETGAISHCARADDGVWHCDVIAEDAAALGRKVDELSARVDALTKEVETHRGVPPGAPVTAAPPPEDDIGFAETLMQRFFSLVREMKQASR